MMEDLFYREEIEKSKEKLTLDRVSTGIPKLDDLLQGGYPKNSIVLVSGPPGSGKTILCFHFIDKGIKQGEKCLYIAVDQNVKSLLIHACSVGFDFLPAMEKGLLKMIEVDIEKSSTYNRIANEVIGREYQRVVFDSLSPFIDTPFVIDRDVDFDKVPIIDKLSAYPADSRSVLRFHLRRLFDLLRRSQSTSVVTSELLEGKNTLSRDGISEFLADGVILLSVDPLMDRRKLTIWKMRGTKHTLKPQDMIITGRGIDIK